MSEVLSKDTIAAISTASGEGGIGIVRLSGERALSVAENIFISPNNKNIRKGDARTIHYGYIVNPENNETVDEVLLSVMKGPNTYTKEDIIEINCHGGMLPLKKVLELTLSSGARLAEPGEFTKRAFLNGRIDLSQAEAVLDIISSQSEMSNKVAIEQLRGTFSEEVCKMRNDVIDLLALIEVTIDFSDEDIEQKALLTLANKTKDVKMNIKKIFDTSEKGILYRQGVNAVICGKPNVGKSSLMNALLRDERVIVTPIAGTTRDLVEESININGVLVRLTDTAGIIETTDRVEIEGIKRSKKKLEQADIVIFMLDISRKLSEKDIEIFDTIKDKKTIVVCNKKDIANIFDANEIKRQLKVDEVLEVSAIKREGLEEVEEAISSLIFDGAVNIPEGPVVTNIRHKQALERALEALEQCEAITSENFNGELVASDLKNVEYYLGLIIGESIEDDVLDRIFEKFCIGK